MSLCMHISAALTSNLMLEILLISSCNGTAVGFTHYYINFTVPKAFKLLWYLLSKLAKQSTCIFANEYPIGGPLCLSGAKRIGCPSLIFRCVMTEPRNIIILPGSNAEYHAYVNQMKTLIGVYLFHSHSAKQNINMPYVFSQLTCHRHLF